MYVKAKQTKCLLVHRECVWISHVRRLPVSWSVSCAAMQLAS